MNCGASSAAKSDPLLMCLPLSQNLYLLLSSFTFTQLDPRKPSRKFSFLLQVDDNDKYGIAECQPSLDVEILLEVAKALNDTDDMSFLVRRMSKSEKELEKQYYWVSSNLLSSSPGRAFMETL